MIYLPPINILGDSIVEDYCQIATALALAVINIFEVLSLQRPVYLRLFAQIFQVTLFAEVRKLFVYTDFFSQMCI